MNTHPFIAGLTAEETRQLQEAALVNTAAALSEDIGPGDLTKTKKSFVLDASHESLLIYWLHLVIIYNTLFGKQNIANYIGPALNVLESIAATLLLMVLMILAAKVWGSIKMKYPKYATKVAWGVVGVLFIIFLIG